MLHLDDRLGYIKKGKDADLVLWTDNPLSIYVSITSNYVTMKNYIIQKKYNPPTTGTGLSNLDNRYMLLTGKTILIYKDSEHFTVKLPLLKPQS